MKRLTLSKEEIIDITNRACALLYHNTDEKAVLALEEHGDTIVPRLLHGNEANGKCDLFPRGTDPSLEIYAHLSTLYRRSE